MITLRNSMGLGWGQTRDPWMKKFNHLSNEFDFWKVHGIMNTLGLISVLKLVLIFSQNFNLYLH